jgi:GntR family transcriptional regulator
VEGHGLNYLTGKIKLDFRSSEPIYLQIAHQIEQQVASGALKLGDQLPTVRELAAELRINFNTVGRAYRLLDEARLISTQRGRGTYIWEEPTEETLKQISQAGLNDLAQRYLQDAAALGFTPLEAAAAVNHAVRLGTTDSEPVPDRTQTEDL